MAAALQCFLPLLLLLRPLSLTSKSERIQQNRLRRKGNLQSLVFHI